MGSYDGAKICELVVLYLLNRVSTAIVIKALLVYMGLLEQMKQFFSMLPSPLQQRKNTFLFE